MAASPIGDMGEFLKTFPSYTERDYMYKLSVSKIRLLSIDLTHTKYLYGEDKEKWEKHIEKLKKIKQLQGTYKDKDTIVVTSGSDFMKAMRGIR